MWGMFNAIECVYPIENSKSKREIVTHHTEEEKKTFELENKECASLMLVYVYAMLLSLKQKPFLFDFHHASINFQFQKFSFKRDQAFESERVWERGKGHQKGNDLDV